MKKITNFNFINFNYLNIKSQNMKKIISTLLFGALFLLASCSSKINSENYNKINNGMSKSEVQAILGEGESQAESSVDMGEYGGNISSEAMTWQDGMKVISITFSNGKVLAKAKTGL